MKQTKITPEYESLIKTAFELCIEVNKKTDNDVMFDFFGHTEEAEIRIYLGGWKPSCTVKDCKRFTNLFADTETYGDVNGLPIAIKYLKNLLKQAAEKC